MRFLGKTAVVTGGANGIGAAIVRHLARDGARVAILDVAEPDHGKFSDITTDSIISIRCDVSNATDIKAATETVLKTFGPVSILVNNAGNSGKTKVTEIEDLTDEIWHHVIDLNLTSILRFTREFVPGMRSIKFGRIINMSSSVRHGARPFPTMKSHFSYAVAKGAMVTLTRQLGLDLGAYGITCNAVAPGMILPDPEARITKIIEAQSEAFMTTLMERIAVKRTGDGDDVASLVAFLASEASGYINGETIDIKGG